jgi:L-cysteine S-thiosulfotransferase
VPEKVAAAILERETKNIKYPADGKLMGDWKIGQKYYTMGFAYRIGTVEPDDPKKDRGGNCYACHSADPKEVAYGTIGPGLTGYGKLRGSSDDIVKYTYEKIYNAQAFFTACSQMPRLGHNGILTPEKIAHITALYLSWCRRIRRSTSKIEIFRHDAKVRLEAMAREMARRAAAEPAAPR